MGQLRAIIPDIWSTTRIYQVTRGENDYEILFLCMDNKRCRPFSTVKGQGGHYLIFKATSVLPVFNFTFCSSLMRGDVSASSHLLLQGTAVISYIPTPLAKETWSSFTSGENVR